jgi:hypothetical protein
MPQKRIQLTLFIPENDAVQIETIRQVFNPAQHALIKSHVTLCREEELEHLGKVIENLEQLEHKAVTIDFGDAVRFADGAGVLLPLATAMRIIPSGKKSCKALSTTRANPNRISP